MEDQEWRWPWEEEELPLSALVGEGARPRPRWVWQGGQLLWLWPVHGEYQIESGLVKPRRIEGGRYYSPAQADELPSALARIADGNEDDVLDFVHRYGLLGLALLDPDRTDVAEPIDWIRAHARGVRIVMDGLYATAKGDTSYAVRVFLDRSRWGTVGLGPRTEPAGVAADPGLNDDELAIAAINLLAVAARGILNENLVRVRKRVELTYSVDIDSEEVSDKPRLVPDFGAMAMIDFVYSKLADQAASPSWRLCNECGAPFSASSPRQRFCPPRYGERESRCSLRFRQRLFRKRHKGGEGDAEATRAR